MQIHIHSKYIHLKEEILKIPNNNYNTLHTFCNNRNIVQQIKIGDSTFVVKRYKVPNIANRIIYTFFRKSKARRAYDNALKILRYGVSTPFPVAYIETKKKTLFHTGYFISEYMSHPTLAHYNEKKTSYDDSNRLKEDFLNFTIELHEKNILPLDYNTGNIFYYKDKESGRYKFALTDINRATFGKFPKYRSMLSFAQIGISPKNLVDVITEYSSRRKLDLEASLFVVLYYRIRRRLRIFLKQQMKRILSTSKQRLFDTNKIEETTTKNSVG